MNGHYVSDVPATNEFEAIGIAPGWIVHPAIPGSHVFWLRAGAEVNLPFGKGWVFRTPDGDLEVLHDATRIVIGKAADEPRIDGRYMSANLCYEPLLAG